MSLLQQSEMNAISTTLFSPTLNSGRFAYESIDGSRLSNGFFFNFLDLPELLRNINQPKLCNLTRLAVKIYSIHKTPEQKFCIDLSEVKTSLLFSPILSSYSSNYSSLFDQRAYQQSSGKYMLYIQIRNPSNMENIMLHAQGW